MKQNQARLLADLICLAFTGYRATFDLEDCDKVLRISSDDPEICHTGIIGLLESFGYEATVMEDIPLKMHTSIPFQILSIL